MAVANGLQIRLLAAAGCCLPPMQAPTRQQLVERLLALVVAAANAGAAGAAHGINLIDEDDARGVLLGLHAHTRSGDR